MARQIYDSYVHSYLYNRYVEQLNNLEINFGKLFNELNFFVKRRFLDKIPDPEYIEVKYPEISDEWISGYKRFDLIEKLLEKNENPEVHYNYSFTLIDRRLFSLFYYWLLSAVDGEAKLFVNTYLKEIKDLIEFVSTNTSNSNNSWNTYIDLWAHILKNIVETNSTYKINEVRFGNYVNKQEYYYLLALLEDNKV